MTDETRGNDEDDEYKENDEDGETDEDDDGKPKASVDRLHDELRATEELPVERSASRWIGEAQAVAADAAGANLSEDVLRERMGHVRDLLDNVTETGSPEADAHVERARAIAARIVDDQ